MEKILVAHNYYQRAGGEDRVFEAEAALLERYGHKVIRYIRNNDDIRRMSSLATARATIWNRQSVSEFRRLICSERPDVAHFHNTFPLISPAVYYACRAEGVPVVQTLHNYRLLCPNALFFRENSVCEKCLTRSFKWPAIRHGCYRGSRLASATVSALLWTHGTLGTWRDRVDAFIALSQFSRRKFVEGGLDESRIAVKPNFVEDPLVAGGAARRGALFVGRLSEEKGIRLLIEACKPEDVPLTVIGDGPLSGFARQEASPSTDLAGARDRKFVLEAMRRAAFLVFPSECYENMSVVVLEALASGLPVIAPRSGPNPDVIRNGETGLLFEPHSAHDLRSKIHWAVCNAAAMERMGKQARRAYEQSYTPERNYTLLAEIYRDVITAWRKSSIAGVTPVAGAKITVPRGVRSQRQTS